NGFNRHWNKQLRNKLPSAFEHRLGRSCSFYNLADCVDRDSRVTDEIHTVLSWSELR
ncbi:hypothetical protein BIW11_11494, partial [Tropilaelaps mercedesae]